MRSFRFLAILVSALLLNATLILLAAIPLQGQPQKLYVPALVAEGAGIGIALVNPTLMEAAVTLTARSYNGELIQNGIVNPATLILPASGQRTLLMADVFGTAISGQSGWVEVSSATPAVKASFLTNGSELIRALASLLIFPKVSSSVSSPTQLTLVNTASEEVQGTLSLYENDGRLVMSGNIRLPAFSGFSGNVNELAPVGNGFEGYAVVDTAAGPAVASETLIGFESYRNLSHYALMRAFPESAKLRRGYLPHFSCRAGYSTTLTLVNFSNETQVLRVTAEALQADGIARAPSSATVERTILPGARLEESAEQMFNFGGEALITGYIRFETVGDTSGVVGFLDYGTASGPGLSALEARAEGSSDMLLSPVAEGADYWTALALLNPNREPSVVTLDSFDLDGNRMASAVVNLSPGEREVNFFDKLFQPGLNQIGGYVRATATRPAFALEIFGSRYSSGLLANVAAQGARLIPQLSGRLVYASRGAKVISADGSTSLLVAANALSADTAISVSPLSIDGLPWLAPDQRPIAAVKANPVGTHFQIPVRLAFALNTEIRPGTRIPVLILNPDTQQYDQTEFVAIVDGSGRTASAEVTHFTTFVAATSAASLSNVTSINPSQGLPGTEVTIAGTGFSGNMTDNVVTFAGTNNTSVLSPVTAGTATSLQVTVPDGAVTGPVVVRSGQQSSIGVTFTVPAVNPVPSEISISPSNVAAGTDSIDVWISGTGFMTNSIVNYLGVAMPFTFVDSTLLGITLSTHDLTMGIHPIQVVNPAPGGGPSEVVEFAVPSAADPNRVALTGSDKIRIEISSVSNQPPSVYAGADQTITLLASANLNGRTSDDGLPAGGTLTTNWSMVSGPGTVTFGNVNALSTTASFSTSGTYVLQLTASDGVQSASSTVTIVVNTSSSTGNTYYVSNSGSDSNSGTSTSSPWKTMAKVQSFLGSLRGGDSVLFQRGGIWYEQLDMYQINVVGASGNPITFGNYGSGNLPIIDGGGSKSGYSVNGGRPFCIRGMYGKISYVTIDGFECRNTSAYGIAFNDIAGGSFGITVQNSYIHDTGDGDYGYHNQLQYFDWTQNTSSGGTKFLNNKVGNCYGHNCIQIDGDRNSPLMQGNECYGWSHNCIDVKRSQGVLVDSNVVHDGLGNEVWAEAFYIENEVGITWTADVTWTRNVVYGNVLSAAFQCQDAGGPVTCRVYNNTVHANTNGVHMDHDPGQSNALNVYVENNVFDTPNPQSGSGYKTWDYNDHVQSSPIGSHDMHVDPQFMNTGANNFHLQSTSPVIGKGTNVGLPYSGSAPDMGAFQH